MIFAKDPEATLDYTIDWAPWLAESADVIASSEWHVQPGLTLVSHDHTQTTATAWISGGVSGRRYLVSNRISTAAGRIDDRSFYIRVIHK